MNEGASGGRSQSVPEMTDIVATIGGGSMISGVATAAKSVSPDLRVWGVETVGSDSMAKAVQERKPILHDLHSIFPKRLKCCVDRLKSPRVAGLRSFSVSKS